MFLRRLPKFEYLAPDSLDEAIRLKAEFGERATVLAGGTDLLVYMKKRNWVPDYVINLKTIPGLKEIAFTEADCFKIGALCTLSEIEGSETVRKRLPTLWDAVHVMGSVQIRNLGTIGGNLCSAWPSADTAPALIALGALLKLVGSRGERSIPVADFFTGPGKSVIMETHEILTEIAVPCPPPNSAGAYIKLMRRDAMDLSIAGAAAYLVLDSQKSVCTDAKIALGAVAPRPIRMRPAEQVLLNRQFDADIAAEAGRVAAENVSPRDSIRASAEYRKTVIEVLVERVLLASCDRIKNSSGL